MLKKTIVLMFAASALALTACDSNDNKGVLPIGGGNPNLSPEAQTLDKMTNMKDLPQGQGSSSKMLIEYRYTENGCTTHTRSSISMEQFCRNLQSSANRGCAVASRKARFEKECSGQTWDPEAVDRELVSKPGPHANCFLSDPNEDSLPAKNSILAGYFVNDFHNSDEVSVLTYGKVSVYIFMTLKDGNFTIKYRAFDNESGKFLMEDSSTTKDAKPEEFQLESVEHHFRVICWPTIR